MKHTAEDHPDYKNIGDAVRDITAIAEFVNQKKQEADNLNRLINLQQQIQNVPEVNPSYPPPPLPLRKISFSLPLSCIGTCATRS